MAAKKRRRRKKRVNPIFIGIVVIFLLLVTAASVFLIRRYAPSKERMDLELYYQLEDADDLAIIVQNSKIEDHKYLHLHL